MTRRQRLSETQLAEVFDPPTEQRELVRHYTLSETDLAAIACCRGDHNRLGHAVMRCHLRYPGRAFRVGERPPAAARIYCRAGPQAAVQSGRHPHGRRQTRSGQRRGWLRAPLRVARGPGGAKLSAVPNNRRVIVAEAKRICVSAKTDIFTEK